MIGDPLTGERAREKKEGVPVDGFRIRRALLNGRKSLLAAAIAGLVLGYLGGKFLVKSPFKTAALIKFEGGPQIEGLPATDHTALGAAAEAFALQPLLERVREEIGFKGNLTTLSKLIEHSVDHQSNVIHVLVSADTAQGVADFAKTVSEVFIEYHEDQQKKRIEVEIGSVDKRIVAAEGESDRARTAYNSFRDEHGIADLTTEQQNTLESAAKLSAKAELATSEIRALEARVKSLEQQLAATPKTTTVGTGSPERAALRRLQAELATARTTLSPQHPRVQALQQQVAELRKRSGSSTSSGGTVTASTLYQTVEQSLRAAKANLEALREQQKGLQELADKAQGRVTSFSQIEGQATSLLSQVKVSEQLVTDLNATKTRLRDNMRRPESGFIVLDPGAVPEYAKRSRTKAMVFGGVPIAVFLGMLCWLLSKEFTGLRVRTPAEFAYWGSAPVVGATPWPRDEQAIEDLVADLDDYAPESQGSLLIVGARDQEETLVADLTDRLSHDWFADPTVEDQYDDAYADGHAPYERFDSAGALVTPAREGSGPIPMPPPVQQYPLPQGGSTSTALATRPRPRPTGAAIQRHVQAPPPAIEVEAWSGPSEGQPLRRAARLADRVLVLVPSGELSAMDVRALSTRLGRDKGIGYLVVNLEQEMVGLPDRAGDVDSFWNRPGQS